MSSKGGSGLRRAFAGASALIIAVGAAAQAQDRIPAPAESLALIRADNMRYDPQTEVVSAEGNVEIDYRGEHVTADRVSYDQKADKVLAEGHVTIIDKDGNVFFTDRAELTDQMREGVVDKVSILFGKNARIAANSAVRHKDTATVFAKAVYSPCDVCRSKPKKPPLWQLKARRVTHDKADQQIYYRDMTFELAGVPIAYTPYFSHPDPSVKRKTGFLYPSFGTSSVFGTFITLPFYWAIQDNMDATLTPTFQEEDTLHMRGEYRHRLRRGSYVVDGSIVRADELNDANQETGRKDLRGHFFADGRFRLDPVWQWGFNVQTTTDDTYLRRYKISSADRLENHLYLLGIENRNYFTADAYTFQDLRFGDAPGQSPIIAPSIEGNYSFSPGGIGGIVNLRGSFLSLTRSEGADVRRLSGTAEWERQFTLPGGQLLTGFASVRSDFYSAKDLSRSTTAAAADDETVRGRVLPEAGIDLRWPFVRQYNKFQHVIEPIVQFVYAPEGGNSGAIPNEDSQTIEFDENNLFSRNRFPGLDRWEDGTRLNYGIRSAFFWGKDSSAEILIGQSYRFNEESPFATGTGLDEKSSDIVGAVTLRPRRFLELAHRFRLDDSSLGYQRNETSVALYFWRLNASATYTSINRADRTLLTNSLKAVSGTVNFRLAEKWTFNAATQRDLTNDRTVYRQIGIGYLNECLSFNVLYRQDYAFDRDITPSSAVVFQIRLVNLG